MAKKITVPEVDMSSLKMLKNSYKMYEKTIADTRKALESKLDKNGNRIYDDDAIDKQVEEIRNWEEDIITKYVQIGGNVEDLKSEEEEIKEIAKNSANRIKNDIKLENNKESVTEKLKKLKERKKKKEAKIKTEDEADEKERQMKIKEDKPKKKETIKAPVSTTFIPENMSFETNEAFDVIPLPSRGECYKDKLKRVAVSYLTAYDENIIASPNLYRDNLILDYLLSEKIKSEGIDPGELIDGDREAIILWLRATGYGNEYPISVTDNETGEEFKTVFDLSKLKFKDFLLTGDENGWFDFTAPISKDKIKFKFLTHNEIKEIEELEEYEDKQRVKKRVLDYTESLKSMVETMKDYTPSKTVNKLNDSIEYVRDWGENIEEGEEIPFTHLLTNRIEMSIMSVNGNEDREYIGDYVRRMNIRDSSELRRYIAKNEPGIDFLIEVDRPESLGGGSTKLFLKLDKYLFLNTAE